MVLYIPGMSGHRWNHLCGYNICTEEGNITHTIVIFTFSPYSATVKVELQADIKGTY